MYTTFKIVFSHRRRHKDARSCWFLAFHIPSNSLTFFHTALFSLLYLPIIISFHCLRFSRPSSRGCIRFSSLSNGSDLIVSHVHSVLGVSFITRESIFLYYHSTFDYLIISLIISSRHGTLSPVVHDCCNDYTSVCFV